MNRLIDKISGTRGRLVATIALLLLTLVAIGLVLLFVYWPFTRQSLVDALQEQSARPVEIGHFYSTYFPPGCVAEDIRFLHRVRKEKPPVITIRKLIVRGSYSGLLRSATRIEEVHALNLRVTIPPRAPEGVGPDNIRLATARTGRSVLISRIVADQALLEVSPAVPGGRPYTVRIRRLSLEHVSDKDQFLFRTVLSISKPPGEIRAQGTFGPWDRQSAGLAPVNGSYAYTGADLGAYAGLAGTLWSKGKFAGTLARLQIDGEAGVPDLRIEDSSHTVPLAVQYRAIVNATNGDTYLQSVQARAWKTDATFIGTVTGTPGERGKTAMLDFATDQGRIEDLFRMFVRAPTPPMSGVIKLRASARVPPGPQPFLMKLKMHGDFGIGKGEFQKPQTQAGINRLSESATRESGNRRNSESETVFSDLSGHFALQDGVATFTDFSFSAPGVSARLHGTFGLISKKVDLHGVLETTGSIAGAASGLKSFLLKLITPFLKKQRSAKLLPFKITGMYGRVSVGLDLGGER